MITAVRVPVCAHRWPAVPGVLAVVLITLAARVFNAGWVVLR